MYLDIAEKLRECRRLPTWTRETLAAFFGVPIGAFSQDGSVLTYHQSGSHAAVSYVLKGTVFLADTRQIVRGYPRILPVSDYTTERFAATQERTLFKTLRDGEVIVEKKKTGSTSGFTSTATRADATCSPPATCTTAATRWFRRALKTCGA